MNRELQEREESEREPSKSLKSESQTEDLVIPEIWERKKFRRESTVRFALTAEYGGGSGGCG